MSKKIFLSPSNQNANSYAWGDTTEDVQCGRIAESLNKALTRCGFETRLEQYDTMQNRVAHSDSWGADMHVAIHTNASVNHTAGGAQVFYYAENGYGNRACRAVYDQLKDLTPGSNARCCRCYSGLYEVYKPRATSVYVEAEFHDVANQARWITEHTTDIAEAICQGICVYYNINYVNTDAPLYKVQTGAFAKRENAEKLASELKEKGYSVCIVQG